MPASARGAPVRPADGGVFPCDDAAYRGSTRGTALAAPVVGMAADRVTGGYWLVGADGGIVTFNPPFCGAPGRLSRPR